MYTSYLLITPLKYAFSYQLKKNKDYEGMGLYKGKSSRMPRRSHYRTSYKRRCEGVLCRLLFIYL